MSHVLRIENWLSELILEYGRRKGLWGEGKQISKRSWNYSCKVKFAEVIEIEMFSYLVKSAFLRLSNYGDGGHNGLILDIN